MGSKKSKVIIVGVIAVLVVIIVLLIGIILGQRMKGNNTATETSGVNSVEETGNDDKDESTKEANKTDSSDNAEESSDKDNSKAVYEVVQNSSASWEQDGKYVAQFDIELRNNSSEQVSDWKLVFDGVSDAEVLSGWNGKFEIKGGKLTITPESYNGTVDANNVVGCGVQLIFADKDAVGKVSKTGELYLSGEKVDTSKLLSSDDATAGSNSSSSDEKGDSDDNDKGSGKDAESDDGDDNSDSTKKNSSDKKSAKKETGTPFANHGALSVKGTDLVDKSGSKYQLKGVSTHGLAWFPDYVNEEAFKTFRDDWGANVVRLAMYTDEGGGYCTDGNKDNLKKLVKSGIDEATDLGMYVIVDWHILHDLTPLKYEDEAKRFFEEVSSEYKNSDNIIYEICNEPNGGTGWSDIKKYAEDIIPIIRKNDSNAIVVVGTPTWSQEVDQAAKDPVTGYDNVMYTLHFYAATHKEDLRNKMTTALKAGLPIFVTEFSICEASGNGSVDYSSAEEWFKLINEYNLSYCAWNVSNKDEKSSLIKSSVTKKSGWTEDDLSETGVWIRQQMR